MRFVQASLQYSPSSFDAILLWDILDYLEPVVAKQTVGCLTEVLRPGGILITCSCSYHLTAADLLETISAAALDSHRILRILENRGQSKDHPTVLGIPETAYLKCLIFAVS